MRCRKDAAVISKRLFNMYVVNLCNTLAKSSSSGPYDLCEQGIAHRHRAVRASSVTDSTSWLQAEEAPAAAMVRIAL